MSAVVSQAILGAWLLTSAFLWPHSNAQLMVAVLGGLLCALFALNAAVGRRVDARIRIVAWWVVIAPIVLPASSRVTIANHLIVGLALLAFARIQDAELT